MKTNILCASLIVILFFSSATLGEILTPESDPNTYDPNTHGTSTSAIASASHGNPYDDDDDSKEWWEFTTEEGEFNWWIEVRVGVHTEVTEVDGWVSVFAGAIAEATGPNGTIGFVKTLSSEGDDGVYDSDSGTDKHFEAYQGVYSSCDSVCCAEIEEGSYSSARSEANSTGWCSLN